MNTADTNGSLPNAAEHLLDGLENSWREYRKQLKRCRAELSNEAVHDLRVAARKMIAIIRLLNFMRPRPRLQKIIRTLKKQLDDFDDLRDTQVILAELSETVQELPELQAFQKQQRSQEDKMFRTVRKKIKKFNSHELSRRIRKTRDSLQSETVNDFPAEILQAVDKIYMTTVQRLGLVDLALPVTIHRVRVAFKTFRYLVELIHPLLPDFPETNLQYMRDYHSLMGEVQDAEVFLQTLNDFSEHASLSEPETIRRYYERRKAEAITVYAENRNQLHGFWRSAPTQAFPWEKPGQDSVSSSHDSTAPSLSN